MKLSRKLLAGMALCILSAGNLTAQCTGGITPTVLTYDTMVVGTGIAPYDFTFPGFDPSMGTLTSVRLHSVVSIQYSFSLENVDLNGKSARTRFFRSDAITSPALLMPVEAEYISPYFGYYYLGGSDGIPGSGPDHHALGPLNVISNSTLLDESVNNTADFMGPAPVNFHYVTTSENSTTGQTDFTSVTTDIINFNLSYVYCSAAVLASNSMTLSAENAGQRSAMIKWNTSNESRAKSYEVMVSEDGKNFTTAIIMDASGNFSNDLGTYQFKYDFSSPAKHLYFRVKQITKDNKVSVTAIKPVSWVTPFKGSHFLPDPSGSFITVSLPTTGGTAWTVALFGSNGQLLQNDQVKNTNTTLSLKHKLQKGIYIVRATNTGTKEVITQKISIQ